MSSLKAEEFVVMYADDVSQKIIPIDEAYNLDESECGEKLFSISLPVELVNKFTKSLLTKYKGKKTSVGGAIKSLIEGYEGQGYHQHDTSLIFDGRKITKKQVLENLLKLADALEMFYKTDYEEYKKVEGVIKETLGFEIRTTKKYLDCIKNYSMSINGNPLVCCLIGFKDKVIEELQLFDSKRVGV